jgi:hypothetical protein
MFYNEDNDTLFTLVIKYNILEIVEIMLFKLTDINYIDINEVNYKSVELIKSLINYDLGEIILDNNRSDIELYDDLKNYLLEQICSSLK